MFLIFSQSKNSGPLYKKNLFIYSLKKQKFKYVPQKIYFIYIYIYIYIFTKTNILNRKSIFTLKQKSFKYFYTY